uniref:Reverse transcriptase domain-containing protein n=1 Tax=Tanacetum cinerariifolium TaxID=118510 RepID=A0A6L2L225_TANCI|nr:reverse transcriptase domain-containing protein [Tanacetum cinerariifolium]
MEEIEVQGEMHQLLGFVPTRIFLTINHATLVSIGIDEAYEMPWKELVKLMIEEYCPRNAIQKLENKMVPEESDKIERLIWGFPDNIQGPCTVKCTSCKKVGHMARNQNCGNKAANNDSHRRAYALRGGDGNPDSNVVTGILLVQQVEFQIDLVLGVAPVARAPYRLALSKMQDFSAQLQELTDKGFIRPSSIHGLDEPCVKPIPGQSVKYEWGVKEEVAFQLLKQKLCSAPILVLPEGSENFMVYCDASWATQQLNSGNSFALTVAKYSSSRIFITSSGNALEHFIPNNPPLNLMLHLQSSFYNQMLIWRGCFNQLFILDYL